MDELGAHLTVIEEFILSRAGVLPAGLGGRVAANENVAGLDGRGNVG